jgi:hypothetical protein
MNLNYPIVKDTNGNAINPNVWYKFDTGLITTNDGSDAITLTNNNSATNANIFVKGNNSINLNGTNQFLTGTITGIAGSSWSVSAWIYSRTNAAYTGAIVSFGSVGTSYQCITVGYNMNTSGCYGHNDYNSEGSTASYPGDINTWVHLVFMYDASTRTRYIYRNGVRLSLSSPIASAQTIPDTTISIGKLGSPGIGFPFNGYIDDLRIYKGLILTQEQILTLYNPVSFSSRDNMQIDETAAIVSNIELIQYPSTFPNQDSISNVITERASDGSIYYMQTFKINNSLYTIKFSSYNESYNKATPLYLFDKNTNNSFLSTNNGGSFANFRDSRYDINTGNYQGIKKYRDNLGEWVAIIFPDQFVLKQYGFIAKKGFENCAPGRWSLYADMENPQLIDTNNIRLSNVDYSKSNSPSTYIKQILTNTVKTNSYVFVFHATAKSDLNQDQGNKINFIEILLYGLPINTVLI